MAVSAVVVAEDDGSPGGPIPGGWSDLEPIVARLPAQYGVDPRVVRALAEAVLASFAGARVQAFIPVLVEKRLREVFRGRADGLGDAPAGQEAPEGQQMTATGGRRR